MLEHTKEQAELEKVHVEIKKLVKAFRAKNAAAPERECGAF